MQNTTCQCKIVSKFHKQHLRNSWGSIHWKVTQPDAESEAATEGVL